jgi:hypothetical protein
MEYAQWREHVYARNDEVLGKTAARQFIIPTLAQNYFLFYF